MTENRKKKKKILLFAPKQTAEIRAAPHRGYLYLRGGALVVATRQSNKENRKWLETVSKRRTKSWRNQ